MIDRNLGNLERVIRLLFAIGLVVWTLSRPELALVELFVLAVAVMLIINGIFSRCYFWYIFNINTFKTEDSSID